MTTQIELDILGRPQLRCIWGRQDDEGGDNSTGDAGGGDDDAGDGADDTPDKDGLTAGGRKLIEQERQAAKDAKRALSPWRKLERDFSMGPDQIREALDARGDTQKNAEKLQREAEAAALKKVGTRIVRAEVRSLATATFADPDDAVHFLNLEDYEVDEDGNVDTEEIEKDLKTLLSKKPHLAKKAGEGDDGERQETNFDGGTRTPVKKPPSMSQLIRDAANAKRGVTTVRT